MLVIAARCFWSSASRPASASANAPSSIATFGRLAAYFISSPLSIASRGRSVLVTSTSASASRLAPTSPVRPRSRTTCSTPRCSPGSSVVLRSRPAAGSALAVLASARSATKMAYPTKAGRVLMNRRASKARAEGAGRRFEWRSLPSSAEASAQKLPDAEESATRSMTSARPQSSSPPLTIARELWEQRAARLLRRIRNRPPSRPVSGPRSSWVQAAAAALPSSSAIARSFSRFVIATWRKAVRITPIRCRFDSVRLTVSIFRPR